MVDDHGGEGLVAGEDGVEGGADRRHRARLERRLGVDRCVPGREQQAVAVPQRHVEVLGQVDDELAARARPAGLDEAQVAGGDLRLERPAPAGSAAGAAASPATGPRRHEEATPRSCRRRYRRTVPGRRYLPGNEGAVRSSCAVGARSSTRSSTVSQVRLAARREAIADLEADRQPEVLQLADVELERLRLAPEGLREIRRPDSGTARRSHRGRRASTGRGCWRDRVAPAAGPGRAPRRRRAHPDAASASRGSASCSVWKRMRYVGRSSVPRSSAAASARVLRSRPPRTSRALMRAGSTIVDRVDEQSDRPRCGTRRPGTT